MVISLLILLHILLLLTTRYIAWPENFVWPYLSFSGLTLYKDVFFIYPPLYFWFLTAFHQLAGLSLVSLQSLSLTTVVVTDVLVYLAAKKRLWPVALYIPLQFFFEGNGLWPDQLLAPIFLLAYLALGNRKWFLLGFSLGLALLTKQTAIYFIGVVLVATHRNWRPILAGAILPFGLALGYLVRISVLAEFYEQAIAYILTYHVGSSLQQLWPTLGQAGVLAAIFLPALFFGIRQKKYLLFALTIAASLGMFTRFSYFHLQPALPFLALLAAGNSVRWLLLPVSWALALRLLVNSYQAEPKFLTAETIASAKTISQYLPAGTKTLILTPSDHYYWLTKTRPVGNFFTTSTPWNLLYPGVAEKILAALASERPKYVVVSPDKPAVFLNYVRDNYQEVLKLPDGSGIFEYNPVRLGQEVQPPKRQN